MSDTPKENLDRWLAEQHHALVNDLATALDLEAGLSEAMIPVRHADLIARLHDILDIEAGLRAIVSTTPDDSPEPHPESRWINEHHLSPGSGAQVRFAPIQFVHGIAQHERLRRRAITALAGLLILALIAVGSASWQRQSTISTQQQTAISTQRITIARQLAAQAEVARDTDPRTALQLSLAAYSIDSGEETLSSLVNLLANTRYSGTLISHTGPVLGVTFSPDGHTLATTSADGATWLWDVATHQPIATLTGHTTAVTAVAFSPDGRTLATGSSEGTVHLWDVASHRLIATLTAISAVNSVAFSPSGQTLATASADQPVQLWDVATHQPIATLTGHTTAVTAVAFSPDGRTLATGNFDHTVQLWDLIDPHQPHALANLTGHIDAVTAVTFSPDGQTLATASADRTVRLWNVTDPAQPTALGTRLTGHTSTVNAVAFSSPDGQTLATASADQTVRLWNVTDPAQPSPQTTLTGQNGVVRSVAFAPDGKTLATASDNGTTILWDLSNINGDQAQAKEEQNRRDLIEDAKKQAEEAVEQAEAAQKQIEDAKKVDAEEASRRACAITGGGLNPNQWASYIPGQPYQQTCQNH